MAGLLSLTEVQPRFIDPILALEGDACWALLAPFASTYVCVYVYDALAVPDDAVSVLDLCLSRLLASPQLSARRTEAVSSPDMISRRSRAR